MGSLISDKKWEVLSYILQKLGWHCLRWAISWCLSMWRLIVLANVVNGFHPGTVETVVDVPGTVHQNPLGATVYMYSVAILKKQMLFFHFRDRNEPETGGKSMRNDPFDCLGCASNTIRVFLF